MRHYFGFLLSTTVLPLLLCCTPTNDSAVNKPDPFAEVAETSKALTEKLDSYIKEFSQTGHLEKEQFLLLLESYNNETDEVKRLKLCVPIGQAMVSYKLSDLGEDKKPQFTPAQMDVVKNAEQYCEWAVNTLKYFEKSLTEQELKTIAPDPDSLVVVKKSVFGANEKCTKEDFQKVINANIPQLRKPTVVSAVMGLAATNDDAKKPEYLKKYKEIVETKKPKHGPVIVAIATEMATVAEGQGGAPNTPSVRDRVHMIRERSSKTLRENGVRDIDAFVKDAVKISPNCLGQISIEAVHLSREEGDSSSTIR